MQMTALKNDLNAATTSLPAKRTRALSGFRAVYGPNSTQYEQAGTRQSERRKMARKGGGSGNSNK